MLYLQALPGFENDYDYDYIMELYFRRKKLILPARRYTLDNSDMSKAAGCDFRMLRREFWPEFHFSLPMRKVYFFCHIDSVFGMKYSSGHRHLY